LICSDLLKFQEKLELQEKVDMLLSDLGKASEQIQVCAAAVNFLQIHSVFQWTWIFCFVLRWYNSSTVQAALKEPQCILQIFAGCFSCISRDIFSWTSKEFDDK
jgi:hypothetical protein